MRCGAGTRQQLPFTACRRRRGAPAYCAQGWQRRTERGCGARCSSGGARHTPLAWRLVPSGAQQPVVRQNRWPRWRPARRRRTHSTQRDWRQLQRTPHIAPLRCKSIRWHTRQPTRYGGGWRPRCGSGQDKRRQAGRAGSVRASSLLDCVAAWWGQRRVLLPLRCKRHGCVPRGATGWQWLLAAAQQTPALPQRRQRATRAVAWCAWCALLRSALVWWRTLVTCSWRCRTCCRLRCRGGRACCSWRLPMPAACGRWFKTPAPPPPPPAAVPVEWQRRLVACCPARLAAAE